MLFDVVIEPHDLNSVAPLARRAEAYGFAGIWTSETAHDPFLRMAMAASATERVEVGTAIAVAFPRSPMVMAHTAWDLAALSKGRFRLGLGTQVEAHITRRFSSEWPDSPARRLRDYINALRAIWRTWQEGKPLRYAGTDYRFTLMTPIFNPGPIEFPDIPIYIAGVNEGLCRLAGAMCQGFHVHPLHTVRYLKERIIPAVEAGARAAGRSRADVALTCAIFVVTGENDAAMQESARAVKQQLAMYASTASYKAVMGLHGWDDLAARLNDLARNGRWAEMGPLISDDVLRTFAVIAPPDELAHAVRERYEGLLDRVAYYFPFDADPANNRLWESAARVFST